MTDTLSPANGGAPADPVASSAAAGEVKPLRYFDHELVLWRGENGAARLIDA